MSFLKRFSRLRAGLWFAEQQRSNGFHINYGPCTTASRRPATAKTGGNVVCYLYDPDWNVEFCGAMDTIDNYRDRYGDKKGSDQM